MTTPDPATLRETLDRIDATPMVVRSNPKRLSDMTNIVLAARRWLDLIEGGKEDKAAHLLYWGWTVIANAGGGDWTRESPEWVEAATRWRDEFHAFLDERPDLKPIEKP